MRDEVRLAPVYVDLYFPAGLDLDRDEIEEALEAALGSTVEIVGAGVGKDVLNLDLALQPSTDLTRALLAIERALSALGLPESTSIAISDPREQFTLGELTRRLGAGP